MSYLPKCTYVDEFRSYALRISRHIQLLDSIASSYRVFLERDDVEVRADGEWSLHGEQYDDELWLLVGDQAVVPYKAGDQVCFSIFQPVEFGLEYGRTFVDWDLVQTHLTAVAAYSVLKKRLKPV